MNPSLNQNEPPVPAHLYAEFDRLSILFNKTFASLKKTPTANSVPSDLVRIPDLTPDDRLYYRNLFLKTRRLFDSLRLVSTPEKAAALMLDVGLWLNRDIKVVGELPGLCIGDVFMSITELSVVGLREYGKAGFDSVSAGQSLNGEPVGISVIVSDASGDDVVIVHKGKKNKNHKLESENLALERSMSYGIEVRVIRGLMCGGRKVYVYDGLYRVVQTWFEVDVFKFKFVRVENQVETGSAVMQLALRLKIRPLEVRVKGYITLDLSNGKDKFPVLLYNDVDDNCDPVKNNYQYLVTSVFHHVSGYANVMGCECVGGCADNCFCAARNGDGFAYDHKGTLVRGKPLVFECGPHCQCPPTCRNRVTQKGMKNRFEVFRSKGVAWGVRSLDLIQAGSFICEYAGIFLTQELAKVFTMNGDNLLYSRRFAERWKEWGDLSQIFSDYVSPASPSIPLLDFAMDVSSYRNLAFYISHSSTPNVFVQPVLYDHNNVSFPHLMLFALENIPPMRELSLDYRVADEKMAICS